MGHVSGNAVISGTDTAARYDETGTMDLAGSPPLRATRSYLWSAMPGAIAVSFTDGRDFHRIALDGATADAQHWCDPDDYRVAYDFTAWPRWTSDWRVTGPRKEYRMVTTYERT